MNVILKIKKTENTIMFEKTKFNKSSLRNERKFFLYSSLFFKKKVLKKNIVGTKSE